MGMRCVTTSSTPGYPFIDHLPFSFSSQQIAQQGNLCGPRGGVGGELSTYPHNDPRRRPRILFLGGGMGAGKSRSHK